MLAKFTGQSGNSFFPQSKTLLAPIILTSLLLTSCSNIVLKSKDPQLVGLENFAKQVTTHLFELNPSTYAKFQKSLAKEISPDLLTKLEQRGMYANSKDQIKQNIKSMDADHKRCLIRVESTDFLGKATAQGLIPIEVKGTCVKSLNDISKASKFDVLYLVGTAVGTKDPMMASIEIKKFD